MKILILGASGMLGSAMFSVLSENRDLRVSGTIRSSTMKRFFPQEIARQLLTDVDVENHDALVKVFEAIEPDVVVNCIGLIKQLPDHDDPLAAIPINTLLPHRLARLCKISKARLVHISTDCVFAGTKGNYVEDDASDAQDLYGKSKFLGEVAYPHTVTLRTSIIGHELQSAHALVEWFLSQQESCKGFTKAVFSGLPTVELARLVRDVIITRPALSGLYHVAAHPIAKYDLLRLIAKTYGKKIDIVPDDSVVIDRSLNAARFQQATGYVAPAWPELIQSMHSFR
jgi:dTDP-4-dehydrorhamnose reductase